VRANSIPERPILKCPNGQGWHNTNLKEFQMGRFSKSSGFQQDLDSRSFFQKQPDICPAVLPN
jgi:hypothetical protein